MPKKLIFSICATLSLGLILTGWSAGAPAQRGAPPGGAAVQGNRGGAQPAAANPPAGGVTPPTSAAMMDFLGPIGKVPVAAPLSLGWAGAPTTDTYYLDKDVEDMIPDEFISNPDSEFDWHELKAWHVAPILKSVKLIGNRVVKPGDTVTLEAEMSDPTGTLSGASLSYYHNPNGRRSTITFNFRPISQGSGTLRAILTIPRMAEPGNYRPVRFGMTNEVRSSKAYFSDYHPAMRGQPLDITVLPHENFDVMPPRLEWLYVGSMNPPDDRIHTVPISESVGVFAKVTDNKAGVSRVNLRFNKVRSDGKIGTNIFQELDLKPLMGQPDVYVGSLRLPDHYEGGEYQLTTVRLEDKNSQEVELYFSTNPWIKKAKFNVVQDPAKVDKTSPKLVSVWIDNPNGTLGEPVTVNAIVLDDKSGVGTVSAVFQAVPSYINNARVILRPIPQSDVIQKSGFNTNTSMYQGQLTTSIYQEPGRWELLRFVARDNADNYLDMLASEHPEFKSVAINYGGGLRIREKLLAAKRGGAVASTTMVPGVSSPAASAPAAALAPAATGAQGVRPVQPGTPQTDASGNRIRRVDMIPPHPPRGACLNCHEP